MHNKKGEKERRSEMKCRKKSNAFSFFFKNVHVYAMQTELHDMQKNICICGCSDGAVHFSLYRKNEA